MNNWKQELSRIVRLLVDEGLEREEIIGAFYRRFLENDPGCKKILNQSLADMGILGPQLLEG